MKRIGNIESNKTYNPRNIRAQIPVDVDEVDGAMERYIRQKYEQRVYLQDSRPGTRQNTGSTSSEDRPPPLPPKPTGRFGFGLRKAAHSPKNLTPPVSPGLGGFNHDSSPPRVNKPSRVFGSNVHTSGDGLDSKLATLREMGFPDDKRNSTVLKGLNGNLDRTVEALIRLGEQNPAKIGGTPTPPPKPSTNGISFDTSKPTPALPTSTNPFDALDAIPLPSQQQQQQQQQQQPAPIQTQQALYSSAQPASPSYNPFLSQASQAQYQQQQPFAAQQNSIYQQNPFGQPQQSIDQAFQNMQISQQQSQPQQQQPLFPNRTGGYGDSQPSPYAQTNPYHQTSFTPPPMPQIPEQYGSFFPPQPQYQSMSSPSSPGNPFLKSSRSQIFTPTNSNPFGQPVAQQQVSQPQQQFTPQVQQASNPWTQQQNPVSPSQPSNPWQSQQQSYQQPTYQQSSFQQPASNQQQTYQQPTFQQTSQPSSVQQPSYQQNSQAPSVPQSSFQQTSFSGNPSPFDKSSILSLYNQPQLAPQRPEQTQAPAAPIVSAAPVAASGNLNPFASISGVQPGQPLSAAQTPGVRHVSHESVDFAGLMGGRHSPDAFSGLSASFRR